MDEYTIKKFEENDWKDMKSIRLESLRECPQYFCPSRDEFSFPDQEWKDRCTNTAGASFGLYHLNEIIGITGIFRQNGNSQASQANLFSSYIRQEYRKKGLSQLFYRARIEWAKNQGDIRTIQVEHRDSNTPSQKAHQKFGFQFVTSNMQKWPDGTEAACLVYQLKI